MPLCSVSSVFFFSQIIFGYLDVSSSCHVFIAHMHLLYKMVHILICSCTSLAFSRTTETCYLGALFKSKRVQREWKYDNNLLRKSANIPSTVQQFVERYRSALLLSSFLSGHLIRLPEASHDDNTQHVIYEKIHIHTCRLATNFIQICSKIKHKSDSNLICNTWIFIFIQPWKIYFMPYEAKTFKLSHVSLRAVRGNQEIGPIKLKVSLQIAVFIAVLEKNIDVTNWTNFIVLDQLWLVIDAGEHVGKCIAALVQWNTDSCLLLPCQPLT